ncbi:MAG: LEA type 2 family protein [Phycisphaerales bacterium]|nr:LEA type 2 family protein [Phycisphaerales bacterium]
MARMNTIRSLAHRAVLLSAVMFLGVFSVTGCIRRPEVKLSDIKISSMSFRQLDLVCLFNVHNPNIFSANLKTFDCDFLAATRQIASGSAQTPIPTIPAGGESTIPINLTISLPDLSNAARQYSLGKTVPYELASRPVFNVLGFSLPVSFNHGGNVPAMLAPKWKLKRIALRKGITPTFLVTFEIRNPSGIHLSLEGVKGALSLAGKPILELDETAITELPDDEAIEMVIPVRVRLSALAGAAGKLVTDWRSVKFDGQFKLKTPLPLRKMLLGKPVDKKK